MRVHAFQAPTIVHVTDDGEILETATEVVMQDGQPVLVATSALKVTRHACVRDSGGIVKWTAPKGPEPKDETDAAPPKRGRKSAAA